MPGREFFKEKSELLYLLLKLSIPALQIGYILLRFAEPDFQNLSFISFLPPYFS